MMSLFLAFIGYIAVEMPFAILEKMIFRRRSKLSLKDECKENPDISVHSIGALSPWNNLKIHVQDVTDYFKWTTPI